LSLRLRRHVIRGLEITHISRLGHNYVLHFLNGTYAMFSPEDFEPILCKLGWMILRDMPEQMYRVN
jgi:hypothetical protein